MSAIARPFPLLAERARASITAALLKVLYTPAAALDLVFLGTLTAMLFRPPDLKGFPIDRVAFVLLLATVLVRLAVSQEGLRLFPATWPLLALLSLGVLAVLSEEYQVQAWSVLAAKWIVPFALFHIAGFIFRDEASLRKLEIFSIGVLLYLTATSLFFLFDLKGLIFPRFILDEGIGIHTERARGPFLQAVANGVSLNLLGLLALHSFDRGRMRGTLGTGLFITVPLALLATRTRAVWIAAAVSLVLLVIFGPSRRLRRVGWMFCVMSALAASALLLYRANNRELVDRLDDRSPVDFRLDMYRAGWQMFTEKPLTGWGSEERIQPEIARRISNFRLEYYVFHNTYLELAIEHGLLGLGFYAWLVVCLFRLAKPPENSNAADSGFLGLGFRKVWPLLLVVYLLNASAVVMNYQFVNGLVFTLAGILSAQNARACAAVEKAKPAR